MWILYTQLWWFLSTPAHAQDTIDEAIITHAIAPPPKEEAVVSLTWESETELRFQIEDPALLSCVLRIEVGKVEAAVHWTQPMEVVSSQNVRFPLVLPDAPPDDRLRIEIDYPLQITLIARNRQGQQIGEVTAPLRRLRWTGDPHFPTRITAIQGEGT